MPNDRTIPRRQRRRPVGPTRPAYAAFYEEIARDGVASKVDTALVGLAVLRLVDACVLGEEPDAWGRTRLEREVATLDEPHQRDALIELLRVASVFDESSGDVALAMYNYARSLEFDANWRLAIDVYRAIVRGFSDVACRTVMLSWYRIGQASLTMCEPTNAENAFGRLRESAAIASDVEGEIWADLGFANTAYFSGNFARAESMFADAAARTLREDLPELRSRALHGLATVANRCGRPGEAIELAYQSVSVTSDATFRHRPLAVIAAAFLELRMFEAAEHAFLAALASSPERLIRLVALVNLLDIARLERDNEAFERYRRVLANTRLTADMDAYYLMTIGEQFLDNGDATGARDAFKRALDIALEHRLNAEIFKLEGLLSDASRASRPQPALPTGELATIANAMRELVRSAHSDQNQAYRTR